MDALVLQPIREASHEVNAAAPASRIGGIARYRRGWRFQRIEGTAVVENFEENLAGRHLHLNIDPVFAIIGKCVADDIGKRLFGAQPDGEQLFLVESLLLRELGEEFAETGDLREVVAQGNASFAADDTVNRPILAPERFPHFSNRLALH
jgi:hypothetical protein